MPNLVLVESAGARNEGVSDPVHRERMRKELENPALSVGKFASEKETNWI